MESNKVNVATCNSNGEEVKDQEDGPIKVRFPFKSHF
jgi:hypothetical protein